MKSAKLREFDIVKRSRFSWQGYKTAWKNEASIKVEMILFFIFFTISFFLPVTLYEQLALVASMLIVFIVELLNSSIEIIVDRIGLEYHELSGQAKDIASAAVTTALILVGGVWVVIVTNAFIRA